MQRLSPRFRSERYFVYEISEEMFYNNNIFISYIKYTNITPPANSKATKSYRDLYADATLVLTWMSSNTADGNKQKHLLPYLATKREFIRRETHKH